MDQLRLGFVGTVSCGKSSAINKLFGIDVGDISPLPGSTTKAKIFAHPSEESLQIADLPGLGDINATVTGIAKDAVSALDLIVNILNADGGVGDLEIENMKLIKETKKPFLVCLNKIDLIDEDDHDKLKTVTMDQLGIEEKDIILTAFDPDETVSSGMIGADLLNMWVVDILKDEGKRLLYLKGLHKKVDEEFEKESFFNKSKKLAGKIPFIPDALALYYCMIDVDTPLATKLTIAGALAYFVVPTDMIPDFAGPVGYVDDAAAILAVSGFIQDKHREQAKEALS
jgi:uncharacterized membrane protein YkvA (DUF1232 family)/GTP-binding protein EngB required for normal cell division